MKKNKIYNKILLTGMMIILMLCTLSNFALATDKIEPNATATGSFTNLIEVIIGIFQVVAVGIGSIMLIVLAIKYMTSAPSDKAKIKQHAVIYIVGACIAFAASGVVQIIKNFTTDVLD